MSKIQEKQRLNVLMLISYMEKMSGANRAVVVLSEELISRGYQVTIAYFLGGKCSLNERFAKLNIDIIDLGRGIKKYTRWQRLILLGDLIKLIRKKKIEIIHAHHIDADWLAVLAGIITRCRIIVTIHAFSYFGWIKKFIKRYRVLVFPFVHVFVNVSKFMQSEFIKEVKELKHKSVAIINGLDKEFLRSEDLGEKDNLRQKFGIGRSDIVLGFINTYHEVKGFEYFLNSLPLVECDSFKVLVVGNNYDKEREKFDLFLQRHKLMDRVIFVGFSKEVKAILEIIDIFVCSSTIESDSVVVTEAMAKEKAVIATAVGGLKEKIKDGENGFLIPSENSTIISEKINFLIKHPEIRLQFGKRAGAFARGNYSASIMADGYEKTYNPLRILFVSYHNPYFKTITEYIENAIKRNGYDLVVYDDRQFLIPGRMRSISSFLHGMDLYYINQRLLNLAKQKTPNICIVAGGMRVLPRTVRKLKKMNITTVLWTIDAPRNFEPVIASANHYDCVFTGGTEAADILKEHGINNAHFLPFAADPDIHKKVELEEDDRSSYQADIAFVGSVDPDMYAYRVSILESISDLALAVWGPGADKIGDDYALKSKIRGGFLKPDEWVKVYSSAKMGICAHFKDKSGKVPCHQLSPRVYEILACKCFLLVDAQRDIDHLFEDGKHLVVFKDEQDLRGKINYYLANPQERERIAEAGYEAVIQKHTYANRIAKILQIAGGH